MNSTPPTEYYVVENDVPINLDTRLVDSLSDPSQSNPDFDPRIFWSVNALILCLIILSGVWCCFVQKYFFNETDRLNQSDRIYQARRQRRLEAKNTENPEERRKQLLASFAKHKVQMTVKEEDLIETIDNYGETDESSTRQEPYMREERDLETGDASFYGSSMSLDSEYRGDLKLRDQTGRLVPNCCAVCLSAYSVGDVVTWSSNPSCIHAFHRECVLDWLIKQENETPCPCCRQEFTDLKKVRKERKINWVGTFAFDFGAVQW